MVEKSWRVLPTADDVANDETGFRFVRTLAVYKAALDRRLTLGDIRVLAAISYFMNSKIKRAWPSYSSLAEVANVSEISVRRAITKLKALGYIFSERLAPVGGGRALTHYGLKTTRPSDIEAMISDAVKSLTASRTMQSASDLSASSDMQSEADCIKSGRPDCIKSSLQEPYTDEPYVSESVDARAHDTFSNDQLEELHQLYNSWGHKPGASPPFDEIDRARCDRIMLDAVEACRRNHTEADYGHIQAAALVALNILRCTRATGTNGGASMLGLFRKAMEGEITRKVTPQERPAASSSPHRGGPVSKFQLARRAFETLGG